MLAAAFAGALFHALISFSVVCHINPLLCSLIELSGRHSAAFAVSVSTVVPSENVAECEVKAAGLQRRQHSNGTSRIKSRTAKDRRQTAEGRRQENAQLGLNRSAECA